MARGHPFVTKITIHFKSTFSSEQYSDGYSQAKEEIFTLSELPLLGVDHIFIDKKGEYLCTVFLDSDKSLGLYQKTLARLAATITTLDKQQQREKKQPSKRHNTLTELLTQLEQFNKYRLVATLLGGEGLPGVSIDSHVIKSALLSIEAAVPTLDLAADILSRELPDLLYYIHPAPPQGSKQATKLSRLLRDKLAQRLSTVQQHSKSDHYLKGSYEILNNTISVTYRAIDRDGATLASRVVQLAPAAYQGIEHKPAAPDFDQLLHNGYVVSNDFRAGLNSNQGREDLLFEPGQNIELFARLNSPGYFYIVAHNVSNNLSYLLELGEAEGGQKFLRYVNADEVNRWLSLGEFEVTQPYGTEHLQLIASNRDLIDKLPNTVFNHETGLYALQARSAVVKTRALKPKRKKKQRAAEATLTYTTMAR